MKEDARQRIRLGEQPALVADRRRRPDKRQVSARWLAGTLLTGLTSSALMGIALAAALDGHRDLSAPRRIAIAMPASEEQFEKGERVVATMLPLARNRETIELSTLTREGDREVVRTLPFGYVNMSLAARTLANRSYPAFDAMTVFADGSGGGADEAAGRTGSAQIYGAKVESEMSLRVEPFPFPAAAFGAQTSTEEAEALVRAASPTLSYAPVQVASLVPFDDTRFAPGAEAPVYEPGSAFRVVAENVSIAPRDATGAATARYFEEIIPFRETQDIAAALRDSDYEARDADEAVANLAPILGGARLEAGTVLRVGGETSEGRRGIVRLSVYRGTSHIATVARSDSGTFSPAAEPGVSDAIAEAFDESATEAPLRTDMPTVYDGIYQAALANGLNDRMCQQLLRMLATDVDFQGRVSPQDRLVVFYTMREGEEAAGNSSQILYVEANFNGQSRRYYRFKGSDADRYEYFDPDGRSAKQFLLRTPVPNGRFTSPFGSRVHPVLGYARPHWGVDWAAPSGTPILASGDGVVESSGWTSGYGRQTVIRHANGYESSYSHQSSIAKGVRPGARVRQGQIIGSVGSSGLSTGNHLHYELIVNGQKVDPMRIKFPSGHVLQGAELETFRRERDRIDDLLRDRAEAKKIAQR